jgi:hypothetical protein
MTTKNQDKVLLQTVPNGTTVFSPEAVKYIEQYRSFARQTANAIINLGLTLIEAEDKLNPVDFKLFCDEVSVPKDGSVYKKLRVIGGSAKRLLLCADRLPNTWTTIYKLASVTPDQFERVADSLNPFITAKEVDMLLGKESKSKDDRSDVADFEISLGYLDIETKASVFEQIYELKKIYHFTIKSAKKLEEDIVNLKKTAKAA